MALLCSCLALRCLCLGLLWTPPAEAARIASIRVERQDVFDSELARSDRRLYHWGNQFHITTRESVIRRELLYKVGDELDTLQVLETERNLRSTGFVGEATTYLVYNQDSSVVDVRLVTSDQWSTLPDPILPEGGGGDYVAGLTLEEQNLLGFGKTVSAEYFAGRSVGEEYSGYGGAYYDPRFLGGRHDLHLGASFNGFLRAWDGILRLPQRSLRDRYGYQFDASDTSGTRRRLQGGSVLLRYHQESERLGGSFTRTWVRPLASGRHLIVSSTLEISRSRQEYAHEPRYARYAHLIPPDRNQSAVGWSGTAFLRRYTTDRLLQNFGNVEDLTLGWWFGLAGSAPVDVLGNDSRRRTGEIWASGRHRPAGRLYLSEFAGISTGSGDEGVPTVYSWSGTALLAAPRRLVTAVRVQASHRKHALSYDVLYLGGASGLRGYGDYDLSGQSYLLTGLEERYFSPLRLLTVCLGAALFLESGRIWWEDLGYDEAEWKGNFGGSLLLGLSKLPGHKVVRFDLAQRLGETGYRWAVGYGMYFGI